MADGRLTTMFRRGAAAGAAPQEGPESGTVPPRERAAATSGVLRVLRRLPRGLPGARPPRRPRLLIGAVAAACLALAAVVALRSQRPPAAPTTSAASVRLARVTQGPLTAQQQATGTVTYAASYTVTNQSQGVFTALPSAGDIVQPGQALYSVDGKPVVLLPGPTPAYRTLYAGMRGADVGELNDALRTLGYATAAQLAPGLDTFTGATAAALDRLQTHLGLRPTGELPLGQAVFLPDAVDIGSVTPSVGGTASDGQTVLQATSTTREIVVQLDAAEQSQVHVGDPATITRPDGSTTPGRVTKVAQQATAPSGNGSGSGSSGSSTVEVDIAPSDVAAFHALDNAVLDVAITTAHVADALAVPVTALLAQPSGGYVVEVVGAGGRKTLVPVRLGLFDDGAGVVQVSGAGLRAGEQVVVAGT